MVDAEISDMFLKFVITGYFLSSFGVDVTFVRTSNNNLQE